MGSVAGYIDDFTPLKEKMLEEIREEKGISEKDIKSIHIGRKRDRTDKAIGKKWAIYPAIAYLKKKPRIRLDWEHSKYRWIDPKGLKRFKTFPHLDQTFRGALNL